MSENFAAAYAESRRRQLGFGSFDLGHRQISLRPGQVVMLPAASAMYLLISADPGVRVVSDTGQYYLRSMLLSEQKHEHSGMIRVQNNDPQIRTVTFVIITWRNYLPRTASTGSATVMPSPVKL